MRDAGHRTASGQSRRGERGVALAAAALIAALLASCQSTPQAPAVAPAGTTTTVGDTTITTGGRVRVETGYVGEP